MRTDGVFQSRTDFTDLTDIISLDVSLFCEFRGFCVPLSAPLISVSICGLRVPFLSHTELTELTDIISLDVSLFCALCGFCVR